MALNISFTCNTIVDENNDDIDCKYQAYHVRTDTWNDIHSSEYNQYSFNLGDADFLTQEGTVYNGDVVVVYLWVNGDDRTGLKDRMGAFKIILDGSSSYIIDPQLKPKLAPSCGFTFSDNTPTINQEIYTLDSSNDDYSWVFDNITMHHKRIIEGVLAFDSVGNQTIAYDWDDGDGYKEDTNTYNTIGDFTVKQKVTNQYNLEKICQRDLRVKYNPPIPGLDLNYTAPIHTTEDTEVTADILDIDNRITEIKHKIIINDRDNDDLLYDILIDENTITDYNYIETIEYLQKYYFTQIIEWNDGFDDKVINYNKELNITNWLPITKISMRNLANDKKEFTHISTDKDGTIESILWELQIKVPGTLNYITIDNYSQDIFRVTVPYSGNYRVIITVTDDYGESSSDIYDFIVEHDCSELSNGYFIFPNN